MIAGLQMEHERDGDCRHADRHAPCSRCAFDLAHALFEHVDRRISIAAIDEAFLVPLEARLGLLGAVIDIARVEKDGLGGLAELASERPFMYEPSGWPPPGTLLL